MAQTAAQSQGSRRPGHSTRSSFTFVKHHPDLLLPLDQRIGHTDPSGFETHRSVHGGAGAMEYALLLDGAALSANLSFMHRGVLPPGGGIGHHFHNTTEEMFLIFDGEAEFTVDGRTSLLRGPVGVPSRMGHSHAIYNPTDRPAQWMNINVSARKGEYDAFDLEDDRVGVSRDERPVFMSVRLDPSQTFGDGGLRTRRLLSPGVFHGPWRAFDQVVVSSGGEWRGEGNLDVERVVYVLSGEGSVQVGEEAATIGSGDAIPILRNQSWLFTGLGATELDLMVISITCR